MDNVARRPITSACMTLALVLLALSTAAAQGMYYKEIRKDDRIYVFNNAEEAERFEKSGEMGRALTRPGAGPNGETVIGDSERALQLFFFKHGIAEVVPEPKPPTMRVEWRDGKTRVTTDNAYLEVSNRVQVRYTQEDPNDNLQLSGTDSPGDTKGSFRIRRAKFKLEGWVWKNNLTYELQMNWPAATGSNIGALLEDANIAWDPQGRGRFRVLFGQFKVPFGHQELTSSGNQSFVDRSIVSNEYALGRDTGVAVQGVLFNNKVEYRAGIFNGNGLTRNANDNDKFQYNARVMWQPNGSQNLVQRAWVSGVLYSEGDFESTTTPIYAVAFNFQHNDLHGATTANDVRNVTYGLDGLFKYKGFYGTAEYYWRERTPETGEKFDADGWFVQASQMVSRRRTLEVAFRYADRDVNSRIGNNNVSEVRGGFSYYYRRHSLKLQADYGQVKTESGPGLETLRLNELRFQTQFIF